MVTLPPHGRAQRLEQHVTGRTGSVSSLGEGADVDAHGLRLGGQLTHQGVGRLGPGFTRGIVRECQPTLGARSTAAASSDTTMPGSTMAVRACGSMDTIRFL
jgi:hypothetical protein